LYSCASQRISPEYLVGEWKRVNKAQYEVWKEIDNKHLQGEGYKIENGKKITSEYLYIRTTSEGGTIYEATVLDQNNGGTITFVLNPKNKIWLSFENEAHDFPKKIQYRKIDHQTIEVRVLGDDDEGFSYKQIKQ